MSPPKKAYLMTEDGRTIYCLFNPNELSVGRTVSWTGNETAELNAPQLAFSAGQSGTLDFTLMFDTTDTGEPVTEYTTELFGLMDIDSKKGRPPWVQFAWGGLMSFKAVITSATVKFNYFASDGTPLRASVDLKLKQYQDEGRYPLQNPTSNTPTRDRTHRVQPGETLDRIAYVYYGDPTQWRLIARRNAVVDPLRLAAGRLLVVPEREAVARA